MTPTATLKQPREIDSVLLRVPTALRERAAQEASEINLSQNAFILNSLLFGVLVFGERKYVGKPKNIGDLTDEIDRAFSTGETLAAFHTKDWQEVEGLVKMLVATDIIDNLKVRPDTKADDTTVFTFTMTKNGKACWTQLKELLLALAANMTKLQSLPTMP